MVDTLVGLDVVVALVDVGQFHRFAHLKGARVGLLKAHNHAEERGLTCSVGANHTHDAVGRQHEFEVFNQYLVAIGF